MRRYAYRKMHFADQSPDMRRQLDAIRRCAGYSTVGERATALAA